MFGLLALVPDVIKLPAALVVGAGLSFYPVKWIGQSEGKQMAATAALTASVQVLRERNTIDDEVSASDAAALCSALGLSGDEAAECVRRMGETEPEPGHVGNDPAQRQAVCEPSRRPQ